MKVCVCKFYVGKDEAVGSTTMYIYMMGWVQNGA